MPASEATNWAKMAADVGTTYTKERPPTKKNYYFRALPELALPPMPSIRATWSSFFGRQKRHIARITEKSTNDDNEG